MENRQRTDNFVHFLAGRATILVTCGKEFDLLKKLLSKHGMEYILGKDRTFQEWQDIAIFNKKNPNVFIFEYDADKGLTWSDNIEKATDWFGIEPYNISDVIES